MNTAGSYKCYCLDGYTVQPDGSCRNARTCYHANCQYGCEVMKGAVRCTCPSPGLRLGPDRRTCIGHPSTARSQPGVGVDIELETPPRRPEIDPAVGELHCTFDHGLCDWISDREGDLHWDTALNPAGGRYLSVQELKAGQRSIRGARLAVQITPPWSQGDLCYSFSHWLTGHQVGVLQLFVRKKGRDQRYSSALWSRTGGHGWRHTQVTLTTRSVDKVLLKAERRKGRRGLIAVDDVTLRQGACR
ncbi:nephronectin-like [Sebastes fasciatus]|uniref:nephronectin-like n=1 Tax=Sebastes fasciatus TaxID=394691 RepID=UPI003D9DC026